MLRLDNSKGRAAIGLGLAMILAGGCTSESHTFVSKTGGETAGRAGAAASTLSRGGGGIGIGGTESTGTLVPTSGGTISTAGATSIGSAGVVVVAGGSSSSAGAAFGSTAAIGGTPTASTTAEPGAAGSSATGGSVVASSASAGTSTGGTVGAGGAATGGAATGGIATSEASAGSAATGGVVTGGVASGGAASGGAATGGATTGPASCDGTPGNWEGCRGSGCWVCEELLVGYPKYFINHSRCTPNTTCGGTGYWECNADCPAPTDNDRADGYSCSADAGTWPICTTSGCTICDFWLVGYPRYLTNHPSCTPDRACTADFGTMEQCGGSCPAPTDADRPEGVDCNGTTSDWNGCRGSGCNVCVELVADYPRYFEHHPNCSRNWSCNSGYYSCSANCPSPTDADK